MKIVGYLLVVCAFATLLFFQCKQKDDSGKVEIEHFDHDSILQHDPTMKKVDSMAHVSAADEKLRLENATSIKFDKEVYDFGECNEGDVITKEVEFTNTGKKALLIENAFGSCGCTIPTYDKEPVEPGKKGKVKIQFDSKHKAGNNTKSVYIQANTNPSTTTITFSVKVNEK